ncbi:MAG: hypothetical protein V1736_03895 [Pseudomonadota bacterium]
MPEHPNETGKDSSSIGAVAERVRPGFAEDQTTDRSDITAEVNRSRLSVTDYLDIINEKIKGR